MNMPIEMLEAFPPLSNPYHHDLSNMGEIRGMDLHLMYANGPQEQCKFLILVEKSTGKRVQINIPEIFKNAPEYQAKENNKKLHDYSRGCRVKIQYLSGAEQMAMAIAEGFIWKGSTNTHDIFKNDRMKVIRYIHKDTKNFYEVQE